MSSVYSKFESIRNLRIEPIPAGRIFKGATVLRTDRVTVVIDDQGAV